MLKWQTVSEILGYNWTDGKYFWRMNEDIVRWTIGYDEYSSVSMIIVSALCSLRLSEISGLITLIFNVNQAFLFAKEKVKIVSLFPSNYVEWTTSYRQGISNADCTHCRRCPCCNGYRMNPIILPPTMGKIVGQTRFFSLGEATSLVEGKLNSNLLNSS